MNIDIIRRGVAVEGHLQKGERSIVDRDLVHLQNLEEIGGERGSHLRIGDSDLILLQKKKISIKRYLQPLLKLEQRQVL